MCATSAARGAPPSHPTHPAHRDATVGIARYTQLPIMFAQKVLDCTLKLLVYDFQTKSENRFL